jgi:site-specific DNA recombinase
MAIRKRAVLYARTSGDDSVKDGRNLAGQLETGREYCSKHNYEIVAELPEDDKGASGAEIDLPMLNKIREMARAGQFDVLIVREIDRLSRNLAKQLIVESELKRSGVSIEYVIGEYADTPEGNFMKHVRASVAEFEREKIRERMFRGRILKVKSGKWIGHCQPYGYKRIGKGRDATLEVDEEEAKVIMQIYQWFVKDNVSLRQIAERLTDLMIEIPGHAYNRPGKIWVPSTVRRILTNLSYTGKFHYAGYESDFPQLALVSAEDFKGAQEVLTGNKRHQRKRGPKPTVGRYLVIDHFFCHCGHRMTGGTMGKNAKYVYYHCVTSCYPKQKKPCRFNINRDSVDTIVWQWLTELMSMDESRLKQGLEQMATQRSEGLRAKYERVEVIEKQIETANKRIAVLVKAFSGDDDETVVATLREQVNTQKKLKADLMAQQDRLSLELSQSEISDEQIQNVVAFAARVKGKMGSANYDEKRELIKLLNVRIELEQTDDGQRLNMSCDLPNSDYVSSIHRTNKSSETHMKDYVGFTHQKDRLLPHTALLPSSHSSFASTLEVSHSSFQATR